MKILAHATYVGNTGYNSHCQNFFRRLSNHHDLRIRNFTVGKNWRGWGNSENPHGNDVSELDKKLIGLQSLWNQQKQLEDFEIYGFKKNEFIQDVNIVLAEVNHYYFYHNYDGPKIAYTVWENTLYPQYFFDKLKEYDQIWVPSKWQAQITINQGIPPEKVKVVPEGVDVDTFHAEDLPKNDVFTFVLFGRWDARKSTREIIQSFKNVFGDNDKVQLLISVDDPYSVDSLNSTEERLQKYNLQCNNIKILHFPSREEYVKILKTAHVFLSCARSEGWNLPLIEAMACGIPSIYSNCSAQLEFAEGKGMPINILKEISPKDIKNSYCEMTDIAVGNWYEPDFKDLENKMLKVYNDYDTYRVSAMQQSEEIRKNFNWEKAVEKANQTLNEFIVTPLQTAKNEYGLLQIDFEINSVLDFLKSQNTKDFIEIGTNAGGTFYLFSSICDGLKVSIDIPHGIFGTNNFDVKLMNEKISKKFNNVHFIHGDSNSLSTTDSLEKILKERKVDFLFIDGDHSFEGVLSDFFLYKKYVKEDGWIGFHDIKDTEKHHSQNCYVDKLWKSLQGDKISFTSTNEDWAGIGLIKNNNNLKFKI